MKRVPAAERFPRTIVIYCHDHPDEIVGSLTSVFDGGYEVWTVSTCTEHQRLIHRDDDGQDPDQLERLGLVAHRFKLACARCGYDVTLSDRLGMNPRDMAFHRGGRRGSRADTVVPPLSTIPQDHVFAEGSIYYSPARQKLSAALSQCADSGVSRLSLAGLDHIVRLV